MNDKPKESKKDFIINIFILGFLLVLLILSVIPIKVNNLDSCLSLLFFTPIKAHNLDSYFSLTTLKTLQDNLRPFIVVLITILTTIYLKIYSDLQIKQNDSIENFRKDFFEAYDKLQEDIIELKKGKKDIRGPYGINFGPDPYGIKTNLRILMKDKIIIRKSGFFDFYKNYKLWNKTERDYAYDHILDNGKNLLQDCLDKIINKNQNDSGIIFSYANLSNIQFRNIEIKDKKLFTQSTKFCRADFSESKINFNGLTPSIWNGYDDCSIKLSNCGVFIEAIFEKSEIYFEPIQVFWKNNSSTASLPLSNIGSQTSTFVFNIDCVITTDENIQKEQEIEEKITKPFLEEIKLAIGNHIDDKQNKTIKQTKFIFNLKQNCIFDKKMLENFEEDYNNNEYGNKITIQSK